MISNESVLGEKYAVRFELGRGGMGEVFAAENLWTGRPVAIKTLRAEYGREPVLVERFWHEARAASKLRHPNVVEVLDMGYDEPSGCPFIVQEFLDGDCLELVISRTLGRGLPLDEALRYLLPVMEALHACHEAGVLHRDVKPSNVFLAHQADGSVVPKLIDFGVSKSMTRAEAARTSTGVTVGTPQYMSPEQARGQRDVDRRTDVWGMGATLFEALSGQLPFDGPNVHVIMAQVLVAAPTPLRELAPHVPAGVAAVIDRAMRPRREERWPTMLALRDALVRETAGARETLASPSSVELVPPEKPVETADAPDDDSHRVSWTAPEMRLPTSRWPTVAALIVTPALVVLGALALRHAHASHTASASLHATPATVSARAEEPTPPSVSAPAPPVEAPPTPVLVAPVRPARAVTTRRARPAPPAAQALPTLPPAPPRDPLAPDETPYEAMRRRGHP